MQLKDSNCEHPGPRRDSAAFKEMMGWSRSLGKIWGSKVGGQRAGEAGTGVYL